MGAPLHSSLQAMLQVSALSCREAAFLESGGQGVGNGFGSAEVHLRLFPIHSPPRQQIPAALSQLTVACELRPKAPLGLGQRSLR